LVLPDDADPDDFIRKHGVTEYQQRRGTARPHIQFVIDEAVRDRNLHRPADKAAAVEETLPFVRAVRSRIQRREYFDIAMDALRVPADGRRELWQRTRGDASPGQAGIQQLVTRIAKPTVAEEKLLQLLLGSEELRKIVLPRLEATDYDGLATGPIFRALLKLDEEEREISFDSLREVAADDAQSSELMARLLMAEQTEPFDDALAQADSCLKQLRVMKLNRDVEELGSELAEAERGGDRERLERLAMAKLELEIKRERIAGATIDPAAYQAMVAGRKKEKQDA